MKSKYEVIFNEFLKREENINKIGKVLGRGAFGEVRDIRIKNKIMAGKIVEKENNEKTNEEKMAIDLKCENIIRINKIYTRKFKDKYYDLIIMDKAILRDLGKLNEYFHGHNLLKLIFQNPFDDYSGDFLLRFYSRQIIRSLETLERNDYSHFDIKPENLLIAVNLVIKLSDFDLLTKVEDNIKIPGGTQGFLTPEYYLDKNVSNDVVKKQDYFALRATLFIIKYGIQLLKYKKYDDKKMNADRLIDLLERGIEYIKADKFTNKDLKKFLINLVQYKPDYRPTFEQIYRNKWVNKNIEELGLTVMAFENDEEKLIMELQKKDFLVKKERKMNKNKSNLMKFCFKKNLIKEYRNSLGIMKTL